MRTRNRKTRNFRVSFGENLQQNTVAKMIMDNAVVVPVSVAMRRIDTEHRVLGSGTRYFADKLK